MSTPNIDYTSRDFDSIKDSLLTYAASAFPEWVPGSEGDFGVLMLEALAYIGDVNSYYVDKAQREAYLETASQPSSVRQIASLLGYIPHNGQPARGSIVFRNTTAADIVVPIGTKLTSNFVASTDGPVLFETEQAILVVANGNATVPVVEGETKRDPLSGGPLKVADGTGEIDQMFQLQHPGVYGDTVRIFVAGDEWRQVKNLLDGDLGEPVFEVRTDEFGFSWIRFGDGTNGRIPSVGLPIEAIYRTGVGKAGNVPTTVVTSLFDSSILGLAIRTEDQTGEFTGGSDPESYDEIRVNAPRVFFSQQRAVTVEDYRNFALAVPGVTKAKAVADFWSSITLYILGPDGKGPGVDLVNRVVADLKPRTLAGVSVTVSEPDLVTIDIGSTSSPLSVEVLPTYVAENVKVAVEQAVRRAFSVAAMDLGTKISASYVYKTVMDVEGVRFVTIPLISRVGAPQANADDIQLRPWEFPVLGNLTVTTTGGAI